VQSSTVFFYFLKSNAEANINTADIKMLCSIPGIGENTAQKIIDYREQNGLFEHVEDIMKISGIKQNRFNDIKDMITVG
jgi:competence protein ComEA